jgi:hypothetical protein
LLSGRLSRWLARLGPLIIADDDGAGARCFSGRARAYRRVDYRHKETERLARSGAGRHREALLPDGFGDRLCLVAVKSDRVPVDAEDARRVRVKRAVGSKIGD